MAEHTISHAEDLFSGDAWYGGARAKRGIPLSKVLMVSLGAPVIADPNRILNDEAAGASATSTTTFLAQPDVPRALTATGTTGADHIITITGTDAYGEVMVETITLSGTGVIAGKKAFKTITLVETGAGQAGDTYVLGIGDILGIPYRVDAAGLLMAYNGSALDLTTSAVLGTFVAAVTDTPTATTGDVRGTYNPNVTLNGTLIVKLLIQVGSTATKVGAYGADQYAG